jgi:hypothetical protein
MIMIIIIIIINIVIITVGAQYIDVKGTQVSSSYRKAWITRICIASSIHC